jgi:hypothetical protein
MLLNLPETGASRFAPWPFSEMTLTEARAHGLKSWQWPQCLSPLPGVGFGTAGA